MADEEFTALCREVLALSGIREGESVIVLSQGQERQEYVDAFLASSAALGAKGLHLRPATAVAGVDANEGTWQVGATPLTNRPDLVAAIAGARLLVDLIFLLHSSELNSIRAAGTRVLTCIEPQDILKRLFPRSELTTEVDLATELLDGASELRVTSDIGTDVTYTIGTYPVFGQVGYPRSDGDWDHWSSSGMVYTYGDDSGVDGTVVIAPGDILLPFKTYVRDAITVTIRAGMIVDVGGGVDADLLRDYMDGFQDDRAYRLAHIGWGLNPDARWSALATDRRGHGMEVRAFRGNVLFSTGPNVQAGGPNSTRCHLDMPMRNCTLTLDGRAVVEHGTIVV